MAIADAIAVRIRVSGDEGLALVDGWEEGVEVVRVGNEALPNDGDEDEGDDDEAAARVRIISKVS